MKYGEPPRKLEAYDIDLAEVMYYLYLPVKMAGEHDIRVPDNLKCCMPLIETAMFYRDKYRLKNDYVYLSARKGWATRDNPLNRPGWHADGFGTDDVNFVYWRGAGTRFAEGDFGEVPNDHIKSLDWFERLIYDSKYSLSNIKVVDDYPEGHLYMINPYVVHSTPWIEKPGMRQYIKVSISKHRYNLENNSHNYLFNYHWPMHNRDLIRNDPHRAQKDYL